MNEAAIAVVRSMLAARAPDATVCPSEVARALAAGAGRDDWRARMTEVHAAVDRLAAAGTIRLSWKGASLPARAGPYRIGRGDQSRSGAPSGKNAR